MPASSAKSGMLRADSPDLYALAQRMRKTSPKLERLMKAEMRQVAEPLRRAVASEASWSTRIPKATKASTRFTKRTQQVIITVNRKQAPHARPINNDGRPGYFKHPVPVRVAGTVRGRARQALRGNTVWQKADPFFADAIRKSDGRQDQAIAQVARKFEQQIF